MKDLLKLIFSFITHRLVILVIAITLMLSVLVARLFELQIINGKKLEDDFQLSVLREIDIKGQRGNIYDRNGYPLATNQVAYSLSYDSSVYTDDLTELLLRFSRILIQHDERLNIDFPIYLDENNNYRYLPQLSKKSKQRFLKDIFGNKKWQEKEAFTANQLIHYLENDFFKLYGKNKATQKSKLAMSKQELLYVTTLRYAILMKGYFKFIPEKMAVNIKPQTLAEIEENREKLPGIQVVEDSLRVYADPYYFSHIIGYTGPINEETLSEYKAYGYNRHDVIGRIGLEKSMELYLHGKNGRETIEVDSLGRSMRVLKRVEPVGGHDLFSTIDRDLQIATQDILVKQMAYLIQDKLVLHKPVRGETRRPTLKEVYLSLFANKTLRLPDILTIDIEQTNSDIPYHQKVKRQFLAFKTKRLADLEKGIHQPSQNDNLMAYYTTFLQELVKDGYLSDDYSKTSAYTDFEKGAISFEGLLEFYFKEGFTKKTVQTVEKLLTTVILNQYVNQYSYDSALFTEMLTTERISYQILSMLLIEQGIVQADEKMVSRLKSHHLSPLNFMKQMIRDLQITPAQLNLDPSTGAAVIVDVNSGDVLSLVSYPSYDNNRLVNQFDSDYYRSLLADDSRPLYPTATQGRTAPGSTFKMLSAVAGLEEKVISPSSRVNCTGHFTKITPNIACWIAAYGRGHGSVNVQRAIAVSCNSFFNEIGWRLALKDGRYDPVYGDSRLRKYTEMFGLNSPSGIELPESKSVVPGSLDPDSHIENTPSAAMGQEQNAYTPSQMARYMATLANGGTLYKLTLIDRINKSNGEIYEIKQPVVEHDSVLSKETVKVVHQGMADVTRSNYGTARSIYHDFPVFVGGKTGTAQQIKTRASHAVFASFAPMDKPEIAIVVVLPFSYTKPYSSAFICGSVAKDIYAEYYQLNQKRQTITPEETSETSPFRGGFNNFQR